MAICPAPISKRALLHQNVFYGVFFCFFLKAFAPKRVQLNQLMKYQKKKKKKALTAHKAVALCNAHMWLSVCVC